MYTKYEGKKFIRFVEEFNESTKRVLNESSKEDREEMK